MQDMTNEEILAHWEEDDALFEDAIEIHAEDPTCQGGHTGAVYVSLLECWRRIDEKRAKPIRCVHLRPTQFSAWEAIALWIHSHEWAVLMWGSLP